MLYYGLPTVHANTSNGKNWNFKANGFNFGKLKNYFHYFSMQNIIAWWFSLGFPGSSDGKESACNAIDPASIPESGRSPGEENGYPSSILAWRIPWTEEAGSLQPMGSQRVRHNWATKTLANFLGRKMQRQRKEKAVLCKLKIYVIKSLFT